MSSPSSSTGKLSAFTEKASKGRRKFRRCGQRLWNLIRARLACWWRGETDEKEKFVLRKSTWPALRRCWAHIVALAATAALAYLNLAGHFVGVDLPGNPDKNYQGFYQLCLQFIAKVLELLIVASLGTIYVDIIGIQLLHGSNGLPLGLLSSKQAFTEVQYLISPEFRFGLGGYPWRKRWRARLAFGLFIITSFVISILAGPSVAVLVIPSLRTDWPGGGASLWFWGDDNSLWPSRLTNAHTGPSQCTSPNVTILNSEALDTLDCIWGGYSSLAEFFKQSHFVIPETFTYQDGILNRGVSLHINGADRVGGPAVPTFVYTVHLAVGIILKNAGQVWYDALTWIPESSRYYTLRYRDREATAGYAQTWLPAVRTSCEIFNPFPYNDSDSSGLQTLNRTEYPYLPRYEARNGLDLLVPTNIFNSTQVGTQWVDVPQSALLSNNSVTNDVPSALLNVAIPNSTNSSTKAILTCSVDARWVMGNYKGLPIKVVPELYEQTAVMQDQYLFDTPGEDKDHSWRPVQIDIDWLQNLTPAPDNDTTSTSIAAILSDMSLASLDGLGSITDISQLVPPLVETVVVALVVDGMSRVGFAGLAQGGAQFTNPLSYLPAEPTEKTWSRFMAGTYKFPRPSNTTNLPYTVLDWTVQLTGLAYRADSNAYYLALAVLFIHAVLAIMHIAYVIQKGVFCNTWDSITNLVVLAARSSYIVKQSSDNNRGQVNFSDAADDASDTATLFRNVGSGVKRYRTMKTEVRIRTHQGTNSPSATAAAAGTVASGTDQQVRIFFGRDEGALKQAGFRELENGKAYR